MRAFAIIRWMAVAALPAVPFAPAVAGAQAPGEELEKSVSDPPFLFIDARSVAVGRTGVSRSADLSVVGLNPAAAAGARGVLASRFDSPTDLEGLGAAVGLGSVGVSFRHFSVDELIADDPTGELEGLEVSWLSASVFGAAEIGDRFSVGASAELLQEDILGELSTDFAVAAGAQLRGERWTAGASLRNLGADLVSETGEDEADLPARYRVGGSYGTTVAGGRVEPRVSLDLDGSLRDPGEVDVHVGVGVEAFDHLVVRGGFLDQQPAVGLAERDERWTAGAAVIIADVEVAFAQEFGGEVGDSETYITIYYRF